MTTQTADELKQNGNKAFSSGQYAEAIDLFSKAIDAASADQQHVLFSNRSAAYAAMKKYDKALEDADRAVKLKPDWSKAYSRKGAALHGLNNYEEAVKAYEEGLKLDPSNAALKKGIDDAKQAMMGGENPFGAIFQGDVLAKIAGNPRLSSYLADPDYISKIQQLQQNPQLLGQYLGDKRIMETLGALMGVNISTPDQAFPESEPTPASPKEEPKPQEKKSEPEPEPEVELTEEEKEEQKKKEESKAEKEAGNAAYKAKKFNEALDHYEKAWNLDDTDITILNNRGAVYFEMGQYQDCIDTCMKAVERGREVRADFKHIARAYGRIGNSYLKMDDLENALKFFQKSLSEHRTSDILEKLRSTEKEKERREREAYQNPELAEEARNQGNALFKEGKFAEAIPHYTESIKRAEKDPRGYSNRAACYAKLMALAEGLKDAEKAIELDAKFVKAYIRKTAIQMQMREFTKAMQTCDEALAVDEEHCNGQYKAEIQGQKQKAMMAMYGGMNANGEQMSDDERAKNAMKDPKVQEIMADPVMRQILEQMSSDPAAARDHMKNPLVREKIQILAAAGIIQIR